MSANNRRDQASDDQPSIDENLVRYLPLVAALVQKYPCDRDKRHPAPWWRSFSEPSVLTALVTVLLGGLLGGAITHMYQRAQKDREFQQSWLKARADQSLAFYGEYLNKEQEVVGRAYSLVGRCVAASDQLVNITRPQFLGAFNHQGEIDKQKRDIKQQFNEIRAKWHSEKEELGLLMAYYHPGHPDVVSAWRGVRASVTSYLDWAQGWDDKHQKETTHAPEIQKISDAAKPQYDALLSSLDVLSKALEQAREYPWKDWESPGGLRDKLEGAER